MDMAACDFVLTGFSEVMADLIFEVVQESDGGFVAECLTEPIVTQGDDWVSLREAVADAVRGYFFDAPELMPRAIRYC
jgi:hypothetical protein